MSRNMGPCPDAQDQRWEDVGTLEKIYLYPLKSCAPNSLSKAEVCTKHRLLVAKVFVSKKNITVPTTF